MLKSWSQLTIGGRETTVEALGIHSDPATAHRALAELPDLQAILAQQKTVAQATATIATAARTFSNDRAKAAEREKAEARAHAEQQLQQRNDGSWENYQRLPESQKQAQLSLHSPGYAQAAEKAQDWSTGGSKSRALNATTTLITGALGGQTNLQVAANTLAPYAAASIGSTVGHGTNQNETAQAISHFILGGTLAYINGGDPLASGSAAVAAEKTAQYLSGQYNDGKTAIDPNTGEFNPNLLPEPIKAEIRSITGAIASVVGATGDGGAALNAQVAGVIGQNAVENNYYLTPSTAKKVPEQARQIYRILKEQIKNECGANGRATECRNHVGHIIAFAQNPQFAKNYGDLQKESIRYLSDNPQLVVDYLRAQSNKLQREDNSPLNRYVLPSAEVGAGVVGIGISALGGAASCATTFGFGCIAATVGVYTSSDHMITGLNNFGKKASEQNPTITVQGLKQLGLSEQAASYVQFALDTAGVGKAGMSVPIKNTVSNIKIPIRNFPAGTNPNLNINSGQQKKYILGTNEYKTASLQTPRSPLADGINPQILVNQYAGTGQAANRTPLGQPGSVERISTNQVIGIYYENGIPVGPTTNFTIRYAKDGVHIIPARPQ